MRLLSDWRVRGSLAVLALGTLAFFALEGPSGSPSPWQASLRNTLFPSTGSGQEASHPVPTALARYGNVPLFFEANAGQVHPEVKYLSRGPGYTLFLTADEAVFQLAGNPANPQPAVLRARLLGANRQSATQGEQEQPGRSNYFIGRDSQKWHTDIANYGRVRYEAVYPGIDLVYYGNQGQLEYDFVVQPGANPDVIRIGYEGAHSVQVDDQGNLLAETSAGPVTQYKPVVYQDINGHRHPVEGHFVVAHHDARHEVGFRLGDYDRSQPLVIDPVLVYSTFMGGSSAHALTSIAVDNAGNAYVAGYTNSTSYPTRTPLPAHPAPTEDTVTAIVTKLAADGSTLLYSTYLGGTSGNQQALAIGVASDGSSYVGGVTTSNDFPTTSNAHQDTNNNPYGSAFLVRVSPGGESLLYSTYFGGSGFDDDERGNRDAILALAVRSDDGVVVTGMTGGKDFPTSVGAYQTISTDTDEHYSAFVAAMDGNGNSLFSTLLGGSYDEQAYGIALDANDGIHLTGRTNSNDFPFTPGAHQETLNSSLSDGFYARLSADGSTLEYASLFGGNGDDEGKAIALTSTGRAWISGNTSSTNFPVLSGTGKTNSQNSAFLLGFEADGSLLSSIILGKVNDSETNRLGLSNTIAVDHHDNIYIAGILLLPEIEQLDPITSPSFPDVTSPEIFLSNFIGKFAPDGKTPLYMTDLRGNGTEAGLVGDMIGISGIRSIAVDNTGALYVAGMTKSTNFPTLNAHQSNAPAPGDWNGFIAKLGNGPVIRISVSPTIIIAGGTATLSWEAPANANCTGSGYPGFNGTQPVTGSLSVTESTVGDHVYSLTCTDDEGNSSTTFATLRVAGTPVITLALSPAQVLIDQSSVLTWSAVDADSCEGMAPASFVGSKGTTGSVSVSGDAAGNLTYSLQCTGMGGSSSDSITLTVHAPPTVTLHTSVTDYAESNTAIDWTWTSTDAASCTASGSLPGSSSPITETGLAANGTKSYTPTAAGTATLTVTCTGPTGATASSTRSVNVYDGTLPPTITLTSNRSPGNTISGTQTVLLSWTTSNAQACIASSDSAEVEPRWSGSKSLNSSTELTPPKPAGGYGTATTYTLTCSRPGSDANASRSASIAITINHPLATHTANWLPEVVEVGASTTFSWSSNMHATGCQALSSDHLIEATLPTSGSRTLTAPATAGEYTISFSCQNAGNVSSSVSMHTLTVTEKTESGGDGSTVGSNSSGPVDWYLLAGLGLLGMGLRQRRPV